MKTLIWKLAKSALRTAGLAVVTLAIVSAGSAVAAQLRNLRS